MALHAERASIGRNEQVPDQKNLLVVDDDMDIRDLLGMEFEHQNFKVLKAENGRAAFELAQQERVDVVVSDIRMPGGDGVSLLKELRKLDPFSPPVILITGFADVSVPEAFDAGANSIIMKPFDLNALNLAVSRTLSPIGSRAEVTQLFPKFSIRRRWDSFPGERTQSFSIGRGGFFIECGAPTPKRDTAIEFDLDFGTGPLSRLTGTGTVRWSRANGIWVEINELTPDSLEAFNQFIANKREPAFIPLPE